MSTQTMVFYEIVSHLPADAAVVFHNVAWEEYENLLEQVGDARHLRISYNDGTLQAMTLSSEHESFVRFFETLMSMVRLRLKLNIRSFGSATMRTQKRRKGNEQDACFYVQTADQFGNRQQLDFAKDPPPDIAVEVDMHHDSLSKLPIYEALGVPEVWRFDGETLTICLLNEDAYEESAASHALPILTGAVLTNVLRRLREGELQAQLAFDEWLQARAS